MCIIKPKDGVNFQVIIIRFRTYHYTFKSIPLISHGILEILLMLSTIISNIPLVFNLSKYFISPIFNVTCQERKVSILIFKLSHDYCIYGTLITIWISGIMNYESVLIEWYYDDDNI